MKREPRKAFAPARVSPRAGDGPHDVVQGLRAGLAVVARRPGDVVRVAYASALRDELREVARWAASQRIPFVETPDRELERIASSTHHEGLCVVARPRRWATTQELGDLLERTDGSAVALDRVRNPYNVGAILRSAAFFGVGGIVLGAPAPSPDLSPTAVRVAEGGVEDLAMARTTDLADTLARLRARRIRIVGADARAPVEARRFAFGHPVVLVVGHEREGLSARVRAQCDALVALAGSGKIDSLNVAVAASVLVALLSAPPTR